MAKKQENLVEQIKTRATKQQKKKDMIEFLPTGSTILNLICGGGAPVGCLINIVGDKSSGKTLLAIETGVTIKKLLKNRVKVVYDDAERGCNFDIKKIYGIDIYDDEFPHSNTVEDFEFNLKNALNDVKEDGYLVYILDSLDSIGSEAEKDRNEKKYKCKKAGKKLETGSYNMNKQKELGIIFRSLMKDIKKKKCILIIISQVRYNIGVMFGEKYTVSGGKALEFYAAIRLYLAECEKKTKKDRVYGITIKAKTKKNKVGLPFRQGFIDVLFDYGVDDILSNICYLYNLRDVKGKLKGSPRTTKIEWDGKEMSVNALIKYIEDNNLEDELKKRVMDDWYKLEDEISSKNRKRKY